MDIKVVCLALLLSGYAMARTVRSVDYGIAPGRDFSSENVRKMLGDIRQADEPTLLNFAPGLYRIGEKQCAKRDWYISNHDQAVPRTVFLPLENLKDLTVNLSGATFEMNGRFIFAGIWDSTRVTLQGGTLDNPIPPLTQICLLAVNRKTRSVDFRPEGSMQVSIRKGRYWVSGPGFEEQPGNGIRFEPDGSIVYRTGDSSINLTRVRELGGGIFRAEGCENASFRPFQRMVLRSYKRPAPGVVLSDSKDIALYGLTLFYADGMGVLAQNTENITLDGIRVVPNRARGRYYSTQADATHFSGCWGVIRSVNGEYEGMMDDAINVHGTYLKVVRRLDNRSVEAVYMHGQSYGMEWGARGESVAFISSDTLDPLPSRCVLDSVTPLDKPAVRSGARRLKLTFRDSLPPGMDPQQSPCGVENLSRTPEVYFEGNRIANNRARGALFSSPRKTVCRNNRFERVSGSAVVLCGDCRGWFESGACRDITIAGNTFVDVLSSPFQFTEAVISISPVIARPDLQRSPFHSGIVIENNDFITFDQPLVYARSVDGLTLRNNRVTRTRTYPPYHWNREWLTLRNCRNVKAEKPAEGDR